MTVTDFKFISDGPDGVARFEQDANATVLGTWGQDWNHQAAGIVEFHPASSAVAYASEPGLDELNKDKATDSVASSSTMTALPAMITRLTPTA